MANEFGTKSKKIKAKALKGASGLGSTVKERTKAGKEPRIVGDVVVRPLSSVKANEWNPNKMTAEKKASLKHGLLKNGWLKSQCLTIWGSDETGARKDLIIDGEHRHLVAIEAGFNEGPMVFLEGITEDAAKKLTIQLRNRGELDKDELTDLVRSLTMPDDGDMARELGLGQEETMLMLAVEPEVAETDDGESPEPAKPKKGKKTPKVEGDEAPAKTLQTSTGEVKTVDGNSEPHVRLVQLFYNADTVVEFKRLVDKLGARYGLEVATDIVLEGLRRAEAAPTK